MKSKKKSAPSNADLEVVRSVRFKNVAQMDRIRQAAARRGWSVNAYIVRVLQAALELDCGSSIPPIFGVRVEEPARQTTSDAA